MAALLSTSYTVNPACINAFFSLFFCVFFLKLKLMKYVALFALYYFMCFFVLAQVLRHIHGLPLGYMHWVYILVIHEAKILTRKTDILIFCYMVQYFQLVTDL